MNPQDSKSELKILWDKLTLRSEQDIALIEAYVTTRVKEAERLARIEEAGYWLKAIEYPQIKTTLASLKDRLRKRIEALTTTTNGKGE